MLASSPTISVIAQDAGLRHSLAFSLDVEGFCVMAFDSWRKAKESITTSLCLIIDDHIVRDSHDACAYLAQPGQHVILLADGLSPTPCDSLAEVLTKPFDGAELLRMVRALTVPSV